MVLHQFQNPSSSRYSSLIVTLQKPHTQITLSTITLTNNQIQSNNHLILHRNRYSPIELNRTDDSPHLQITTDPFTTFSLPRHHRTMAPEKTKSIKKATEAVVAAPLSSLRPRPAITTAPSLSDILEGLKDYLTPQFTALQASISSVSESVDTRLTAMETTIQSTVAQQDEIHSQFASIIQRLECLESIQETAQSTQPTSTNNMQIDKDFPKLPSKYADSQTNNPAPSANAVTTRKGGLRLFTPVSENQGFQFIYLPVRGRRPFKEIRAELRNANFNSGAILDIHYPARRVVALLVHNDFVRTATDILTSENAHPLKDFDPLDPIHLGDPKFKESTLEERTQRMKEVFDSNIAHTLKSLKPPVKLAVARDFVKKGYISASHLDALVDLHTTRPAQRDQPRNIFSTNEDTEMGDDPERSPPGTATAPGNQPNNNASNDTTMTDSPTGPSSPATINHSSAAEGEAAPLH